MSITQKITRKAIMWILFSTLTINAIFANPVVNPGFEDVVSGKIIGWQEWGWAPNGKKDSATMIRAPREGRENSTAVKITVENPGEVGVWCNTPALIPAKAGDYLLRIWIRSTATDILKCSLGVGFSAQNGKSIPTGSKKVFKLFPNNRWQMLSLRVNVPKNAEKIRIDISLLSPGTIFIDDVSFLNANAIQRPTGIPYTIVSKAKKTPVIDGKLDDDCWKRSIECSNFSLTCGKGVPKASTSAFLSYDDKNLYVAFKCQEKFLDPALNQMDRFKDACKRMDGHVWDDDSVEIFIKNSKNECFQLIINSLGTIFDMRLGDPKGAAGWNANAKRAALVANGYWSIEVAIPLASLGVVKADAGNIKRVNMCRTRHPVHEFSSWSPVPRGFSDDDYWGYVSFEGETPGIKSSTLKVKNAREFQLKAKLDNQNKTESKTRMNVHLGIDGKYEWTFSKTFTSDSSGSENADVKLAIPETLEGVECRYADIDYSFTNNERILYSSPKFRFTVGKASYLIFSRIGKIIPHSREFKTLKSISIPEGESEFVTLMLSTAKFDKLPQNLFFILEMPYCCSLISPLHKRNSISPLNLEEHLIEKNGKPYRIYKMEFSKNVVMKSDAPEWEILPIPLFIKMTGANAFSKDELKLQFHALIPSVDHVEKTKNISIDILPPFSRKQTSKKSKFIIWPWWPFYSVTQHGKHEQASILRKWKNAGINTVATELQLNAWRMRKTLMNEYGLDAMKMTPLLTAGTFPGAVEYLKKHPRQREKSFSGKKLNTICFADMLEGKASFQNVIDDFIGKMAKKYQMLHVDYEYSIFNGNAPGYSKKNIELFRKTFSIPEAETLNSEKLAGQYRKQWTKFRCRQNGEMLKFLKQAIDKANPQCVFGAYSAYQAKGLKRGNYGVDWRSFSKHLDIVMCGYGRGNYKETREAIGLDKPFVGGEGVWEKDYDTIRSEVRLFQRAVDSGSFLIFYDGVDDGRLYSATSKVIGAVADFEEFFSRNRRTDELVEIENKKEVSRNDVAVLTRKNGERLVVLMNGSDTDKKFVLKNKNLPKNIRAIEYFTKKVLPKPELIECAVPANKVKMIYFCFDDQKNQDAPIPVTPGMKNSLATIFPVFRWLDKHRTNIYTVECLSENNQQPLFIQKNITLNYAQSKKAIPPGNYKWRVSAKNALSGKNGKWSVWSDFTVPAVVNTDVIPKYAAPGAEITFKGDVAIPGKWELEIKDKKGATIKCFHGSGTLAKVQWTPPIIDVKIDGEEYYAIFSSRGIKNDPVRFFANSARGLRNPSIENIGKWSPILWGGGDCANGTNYACKDYKVTHSKTYALKLTKFKTASPFWSSNYRCYPGGSSPVVVKAGEKYEFSAWVKNSNPKVRGGISIRCVDENALCLKTTGARLVGKTEWTKITANILVPSGGNGLVFGLDVAGADGTSWFDSFELRKISKKQDGL